MVLFEYREKIFEPESYLLSMATWMKPVEIFFYYYMYASNNSSIKNTERRTYFLPFLTPKSRTTISHVASIIKNEGKRFLISVKALLN